MESELWLHDRMMTPLNLQMCHFNCVICVIANEHTFNQVQCPSLMVYWCNKLLITLKKHSSVFLKHGENVFVWLFQDFQGVTKGTVNTWTTLSTTFEIWTSQQGQGSTDRFRLPPRSLEPASVIYTVVPERWETVVQEQI